MTNISKSYVPAAFGHEPATTAEVLEAAACLLEEEGRWAKNVWFHHHNPMDDEYIDNPFCNGWSACADGALQLVSIGVFRRTDEPVWFSSAAYATYLDDDDNRDRRDLYHDAHRILCRTIEKRTGEWGAVTRFNDAKSTTREMVVETIRAAAAAATDLEQQRAKVPA